MKTATRNKKFNAATASEKRVMIAKDVIFMILAKKFKPKQGRFIVIKFAKNKIPSDNTEVCEIVSDDAQINCQCCAFGAMMMSEIRHNDNLTVDDAGGVSVYSKTIEIEHMDKGDRLKKYFSKPQLKLIEIAFERGKGYYNPCWTGDFNATERRAENMFTEDSKPTFRMRTIMENIVANGGKFVV